MIEDIAAKKTNTGSLLTNGIYIRKARNNVQGDW
jgi:hypothetical protein